MNLYDFKPRPTEFRNNFTRDLLINFVVNLQQYAASPKETRMWLTH